MANSQSPSPSSSSDLDNNNDNSREDTSELPVEVGQADRHVSKEHDAQDEEDSEREDNHGQHEDGRGITEDQSEPDSDSKHASTSAQTAGEAQSIAATTSQTQSAVPGAPSAGDWQAIWSPPHNAYYFYNAKTQETTWVNPLQQQQQDADAADPSSASSTDTGAETASGSGAGPAATAAALQAMYDLQAAAAAQGIDPALAYLDPSLASDPSAPNQFTYTAKFNARTGAFAKPDARDPTHLSEFERAKRMSEVYFDVGQWEKDVEARKLQEAQEEEEGKKRKRPTKKDLVCAHILFVCAGHCRSDCHF